MDLVRVTLKTEGADQRSFSRVLRTSFQEQKARPVEDTQYTLGY